MVSPAAAVATTRSVSDSNLRSCKEEWPACRGRRGNDLPRPNLFFVAAKKNGSACSGYRTTRSAADSILRSCKEEWLACIGRSGDDLPRLILIFVAAKKNGPPAAAVAATIFRV